MTEEIIIDGVKVNECKYFNKVINEEPYCNIDEEHLYTCSSDENCYYKQLKRLEQENKELKKLRCKFKEYCTCNTERYRSALEEIRILATKNFVKIQNKINEVLE